MKKNRSKNKKGIALAVVMMVVLVLTLIGGTMVSVSAYQYKQSINEDKAMQAHFLARAGAAAALEAWQNSPSTNKPLGTYNPVYLNTGNGFDSTAAGAKGRFDVTVTNPNATTAVISSVGTVGQVQRSVKVTINTVTAQVPKPEPSYTTDTGFYDYTSGQINEGIFPPSAQSNRGVVKNEAKNAKGLKIPNKNSGSATLVFEKMLFSSGVQVVHNSIILQGNIIVFTKPIDWSANTNSKGDITLKVYGSLNGATPIPKTVVGTWGVVVFEGVGYYYKNNVVLRNNADIAIQVGLGNMEEITDQSILDGFLDGIVPTMLTVTSYSILWSK